MRVYRPLPSGVYSLAAMAREVSAEQVFNPWSQSADLTTTVNVSAEQLFNPWSQAAALETSVGLSVSQVFNPWSQLASITVVNPGPTTTTTVWLFDFPGNNWQIDDPGEEF